MCVCECGKCGLGNLIHIQYPTYVPPLIHPINGSYILGINNISYYLLFLYGWHGVTNPLSYHLSTHICISLTSRSTIVEVVLPIYFFNRFLYLQIRKRSDIA